MQVVDRFLARCTLHPSRSFAPPPMNRDIQMACRLHHLSNFWDSSNSPVCFGYITRTCTVTRPVECLALEILSPSENLWNIILTNAPYHPPLPYRGRWNLSYEERGTVKFHRVFFTRSFAREIISSIHLISTNAKIDETRAPNVSSGFKFITFLEQMWQLAHLRPRLGRTWFVILVSLYGLLIRFWYKGDKFVRLLPCFLETSFRYFCVIYYVLEFNETVLSLVTTFSENVACRLDAFANDVSFISTRVDNSFLLSITIVLKYHP